MNDMKNELEHAGARYGFLHSLRRLLRRRDRESRARWAAALGVVLVILIAASGLTQCASPVPVPRQPGGTTGVTNGPIAFTIQEGSGSHVAVRFPDGTVRDITPGPYDTSPTWSPDGKRLLVFESGPAIQEIGIEIASIDGAVSKLLATAPHSVNVFAAWSPDGAKIAFLRRWPERTPLQLTPGTSRSTLEAIFVMNTDGSHAKQLTRESTGLSWLGWLPNGRQLMIGPFGRGTPPGIYLMNADGSDPHLLRAGSTLKPAWSPDGRQVLFVPEPTDESPSQSFAMNSDGTSQRPIVTGSNVVPSWSPDSQHLLWTTGPQQPGRDQLWVSNADGSGAQVVAEGVDGNPSVGGSATAWSPDGREIAFARTGNIWVVSIDTGTQSQLTDTPQREMDPAWARG